MVPISCQREEFGNCILQFIVIHVIVIIATIKTTKLTMASSSSGIYKSSIQFCV